MFRAEQKSGNSTRRRPFSTQELRLRRSLTAKRAMRTPQLQGRERFTRWFAPAYDIPFVSMTTVGQPAHPVERQREFIGANVEQFHTN